MTGEVARIDRQQKLIRQIKILPISETKVVINGGKHGFKMFWVDGLKADQSIKYVALGWRLLTGMREFIGNRNQIRALVMIWKFLVISIIGITFDQTEECVNSRYWNQWNGINWERCRHECLRVFGQIGITIIISMIYWIYGFETNVGFDGKYLLECNLRGWDEMDDHCWKGIEPLLVMT